MSDALDFAVSAPPRVLDSAFAVSNMRMMESAEHYRWRDNLPMEYRAVVFRVVFDQPLCINARPLESLPPVQRQIAATGSCVRFLSMLNNCILSWNNRDLNGT